MKNIKKFVNKEFPNCPEFLKYSLIKRLKEMKKIEKIVIKNESVSENNGIDVMNLMGVELLVSNRILSLEDY